MTVQAVGPDDHAEHEHQHQAGQPQTPREQGCADPGSQQRAHAESEESDVHSRTFSEERV